MADSHAPQFGVPQGFKADRARSSGGEGRARGRGRAELLRDLRGRLRHPQGQGHADRVVRAHVRRQRALHRGRVRGAGPRRAPRRRVRDRARPRQRASCCRGTRSTAWFSSDLYYHGEPYAGDPRGILRRVLARAERLGFRFNLGIEPELYVFDARQRTASSRPITRTQFQGPERLLRRRARHRVRRLPRAAVALHERARLGPLLLRSGVRSRPIRVRLRLRGRAHHGRSLRVLALHGQEGGRSRIGAVATFMPKPFADDFRSGAHFNMSLADADDAATNLFAPEPRARAAREPLRGRLLGSRAALHRRAEAHAAAITAVTCPSYNSYQGLIAQGDLREFSWAPVLVAWGKNNRSAMLRLPGNRYCVENRAVDMSTNPYLAAAISLAAGLDGIEHELDPGAPLNDDLYKRGKKELTAAGIELLPQDPAPRARGLRGRSDLGAGLRRLLQGRLPRSQDAGVGAELLPVHGAARAVPDVHLAGISTII